MPFVESLVYSDANLIPLLCKVEATQECRIIFQSRPTTGTREHMRKGAMRIQSFHLQLLAARNSFLRASMLLHSARGDVKWSLHRNQRTFRILTDRLRSVFLFADAFQVMMQRLTNFNCTKEKNVNERGFRCFLHCNRVGKDSFPLQLE